jgi:signal transduction histidine kinase/CheY-like chemotaxis protein
MNSDGGALILTIDDEVSIRASFRNYLEDFDYCVVEAENGRQGIELFHSAKPDLLLVDLRMPEVDGLEVIEEVHRERPETPIIVVSGTGIIADVVEALRKGAWDYLLKPIEDLSVLHHAVKLALERARLLSENQAYQQRLEQLVEARTQQLKLAHEELRQSHHDLKQSESKYRLLFESMLHGLAFHEPIYDEAQNLVDCRFMETNPALEAIFQLSADRIVNQNLCSLLPESGQKWIAAFGQSIQTGKATRIEIFIPEIEKHLDILAFDPGRGHLVTLMADITDRKRLENQLLQAQKMEAIGTLAGGIAHDFNNILGGVMGYAELAKMQMDDNEQEAAHKIDQVLHSCERAKDLVQRILSFSSEQKSERNPIQASAIVNEVLKLIRAALPTTIDIRKEIRSDRDTILADPTQMHQILMNLCTNAHHAMRDQGGTLTVALDNESLDLDEIKERNLHVIPGDYLKLTVVDTGHGIPAKLTNLIFDPYFTTKKRGEGTGLGLAIVLGIASAHGGGANVISEEGKGTCFEVFLPLSDNGSVAAPPTGLTQKPKGKERILFVDDEEILVEIGTEMLETLGYTVTAKENPIEAWECFQAAPGQFDLLVTDLTMPGLTGEQLAKKVIGLRPDFPVVITTGNSAELSSMISKFSHIKGYIPKPMVLGELARAVRQALDQK